MTINDKKLDKKEELDDNAVTTDIILAKTQNKGILQIKVIIYIFVLLFFVILIYFFVELLLGTGFIDDKKKFLMILVQYHLN